MTDDQRIDTYLQHLRASLEVPRSERARVIEEIEHHLRDASLDHQRHGNLWLLQWREGDKQRLVAQPGRTADHAFAGDLGHF